MQLQAVRHEFDTGEASDVRLDTFLPIHDPCLEYSMAWSVASIQFSWTGPLWRWIADRDYNPPNRLNMQLPLLYSHFA